MPEITTYASWDEYRRILRACTLLSKKEGKTVTPYAFLKRAFLKALNEGFKDNPN